MSDPNWHRSSENYDSDAICRCGHALDEHDEDPPFDCACMDPDCLCEAFEERPYPLGDHDDDSDTIDMYPGDSEGD